MCVPIKKWIKTFFIELFCAVYMHLFYFFVVFIGSNATINEFSSFSAVPAFVSHLVLIIPSVVFIVYMLTKHELKSYILLATYSILLIIAMTLPLPYVNLYIFLLLLYINSFSILFTVIRKLIYKKSFA